MAFIIKKPEDVRNSTYLNNWSIFYHDQLLNQNYFVKKKIVKLLITDMWQTFE